jgi:sulfur-carrier protein
MRVLIPGPLRDYTASATVSAEGGTLRRVLAHLEEQFAGLRFRIIDEQGRTRRHIKFFVDGRQENDLDRSLGSAGEVMIVCALSGG